MIRIWLGHESLDMTLAYLKGTDAESEEAQEHANSSSVEMSVAVQVGHYTRPIQIESWYNGLLCCS